MHPMSASSPTSTTGSPASTARAGSTTASTAPLPAPLQKQGGRRGGGRPAADRSGVRSVAMTPSEGYRLLDRHVSPMLSAPMPRPGRRGRLGVAVGPAAGVLRAARGRPRARPLFLHKFTGWPRAGLLHAVFPEARFVHVVRDGRAVASSLVQQPWWDGFGGPGAGASARCPTRRRALAGVGPLVPGAGRPGVEAADGRRSPRRSARLPAESWLELRYEDVVERPREQVQRLLDHLGLEWNDALRARRSAAPRVHPRPSRRLPGRALPARRRDARPRARPGARDPTATSAGG